MTTLKQWLIRRKNLLKTCFVLILLIIVSWELLSIAKTISFAQLGTLFSELPLWRLLAMIVIGLLAIIPMSGYDFTLQKMLALNYPKRYVFKTSWIINTINNIAGFGGLVSMGLRAEFYGKKASKEIFAALAKILLFALAGLSIYSLFSFFVIHFFLQHLKKCV